MIQPEVMIRGDLARSAQPSAGGAPANSTAVAIGRYCFLSRGALLRPPGRMYKGYVIPKPTTTITTNAIKPLADFSTLRS